jgi:hypothetical protein
MSAVVHLYVGNSRGDDGSYARAAGVYLLTTLRRPSMPEGMLEVPNVDGESITLIS